MAFSIIAFVYYHTIGYFGINTSTCIKGQYFYIDRLDKKIRDGDYVAIRFKGSYLYPKNTVFIKIVGCTQGERLVSRQTSKGYGYFCGNRLLGYACNPLYNPSCPKHVTYNEIIPKGYFYALGTSWNAYDSRYWGLASTQSIIGKGFEIW
ncbi:MAG: S26 family signal peptidase [Candidatus Micrarchaeaceae archaeon]